VLVTVIKFSVSRGWIELLRSGLIYGRMSHLRRRDYKLTGRLNYRLSTYINIRSSYWGG